MDEAKEEPRKAAEELVEMKSVHWCASFKKQLCPGVTFRVFCRVISDHAEVEIVVCVA